MAGTIRNILNQNVLLSVGLLLYFAGQIEWLPIPEVVPGIGIYLIVISAGASIWNRYTK